MIAAPALRLGERAPARVEEPADAAALAAALHSADRAGEAVVAFGGATLQALGNAPSRFDVAVSLRRLDRVVAYDPRDMTIGIEAGATIELVTRTLAQSGQFIPFDVPRPSAASVGGTLAAGWAGPRRVTHGRLRDLLIGSSLALVDGTLATAGGMVVKNVTGYDMSKLYVGSLGTLGILTRANFKALPRPPVVRLAVAPLADDSRERAIAAIAQLALEPSAALIIHGFASATPRVRDEDTRLVVMFEGSQAVVDRATRELRSALGAAGIAQTHLLEAGGAEGALQSIVDAYVESVANRSVTFRSTGNPAGAWARALAGAGIAAQHNLTCDWIADLRTGDAIVRFAGRSHAALAESLVTCTADLRAIVSHATLLAGDARLRALVDAWHDVPATLAMMRTLKERFDPNRTLAPGRYVGGL
ncbi:MAG: FAD-binding oxidoreductase [Candidatus Velthaea sp.]